MNNNRGESTDERAKVRCRWLQRAAVSWLRHHLAFPLQCDQLGVGHRPEGAYVSNLESQLRAAGEHQLAEDLLIMCSTTKGGAR